MTKQGKVPDAEASGHHILQFASLFLTKNMVLLK